MPDQPRRSKRAGKPASSFGTAGDQIQALEVKDLRCQRKSSRPLRGIDTNKT
jgi:hypothetical protein